VDEMTWYEDVACLLTQSMTAPLIESLDLDHYTGVAKGHAVIADDLSPGQFTDLLAQHTITALLLRSGSLIDHTAGIANARGIQLVLVPPDFTPAQFVLIDGARERIATTVREPRMEEAMLTGTSEVVAPGADAVSFPVTVLVDGSDPDQLRTGLANGASGVGILRSEWFGWSDVTPPSTEQMLAHYQAAANAVSPYRLNIRLYDIGGDKIPRWCEPYADQLRSPLCRRGMHAYSILGAAIEAQFEAIARCARDYSLGVVVPMVTDLSDIQVAKQLLHKHCDRQAEPQIALGIMIEVPSAALLIDDLVHEIDFVRLGPGDLSQFTLGKLRSQIPPRDFSGHGFHPAVMKLFRSVTNACHTHGKQVTVCLAIEPRETLVEELVDCGVDAFTASPNGVQSMLHRVPM